MDLQAVPTVIIKNKIFTACSYYMGVYLLKISPELNPEEIGNDNILSTLESVYPVLAGKAYEFIRVEELLVVHDRTDINLTKAMLDYQDDLEKGSVAWVSPTSSVDDPSKGWDVSKATPYELTHHSPFTTCAVIMNGKNINYRNWLIDVYPPYGIRTVIIDGTAAITFDKPKIVEKLMEEANADTDV